MVTLKIVFLDGKNGNFVVFRKQNSLLLRLRKCSFWKDVLMKFVDPTPTLGEKVAANCNLVFWFLETHAIYLFSRVNPSILRMETSFVVVLESTIHKKWSFFSPDTFLLEPVLFQDDPWCNCKVSTTSVHGSIRLLIRIRIRVWSNREPSSWQTSTV